MTDLLTQALARLKSLTSDQDDWRFIVDAEQYLEECKEFYEIGHITRQDIVRAGYDGEGIDGHKMYRLSETVMKTLAHSEELKYIIRQACEQERVKKLSD